MEKIGEEKPKLRRCRTIEGPTVVLKTVILDDMTKCAFNLIHFYGHEQKTNRPCFENGLVLAVICRCALLPQLGVGGVRNQAGIGQLHF